MSTSEYTLVGGQQTDGTWVHTGKLIIQLKMPNGQVTTVTLPDDWLTLLAKTDALEDLKYGN
jgi:hypothetical protein